MKVKKLIATLLCIIILGGCGASKGNDTTTSTGGPLGTGVSDKGQQISPPNFSSEEGITEYLTGEWVFDQDYVSAIACKMSIDDDLKIHLSFLDASDKSKGDYTGQISLDRAYATAEEVPDLISIELTDTQDIGGSFLFQHRTVYDGKRVMSWFFAGMDTCVFDMLGPENYESVLDEIVFEKTTGEASKLSARKNDEFYAVFWGKEDKAQSLWLDDARWNPPEGDNSSTLYPRQMTLYENDVAESVLYSIAPDKKVDIFGDDLFPGEVYFVQTDEQGNVTQFINAEYKNHLQNGMGGTLDSETEALIFDILEDEIREYLYMGMGIWFTGETSKHDGVDCYDVILGTNSEEQFVKESFYSVNISTRRVYRYDVFTDTWE